jgi:hypothetical protein
VPPFLAEYCQRKHHKLVLAVSFYVTVLNDQKLQSLSPSFPLQLGVDALLKQRSLNHLKKIHAKDFAMSDSFAQLAGSHVSTAPMLEGEWEPPRSELSLLGLPPPAVLDPGLDSGEEADSEGETSRRAKRVPSNATAAWEAGGRAG